METKPKLPKVMGQKMALVFVTFISCLAPGFAQLGKIAPAVPFLEQTDQSYALYRPSNYTRKTRWPAIILLDDSGQGQTALAAFRDGAETYGFLLASPNNFLLTQEFETQTNPVIRVYEDLIRRFSVDIEGIYFAGMGKASELMINLSKRLQTNAGLILTAPRPGDLEKLSSFDMALAVALGSYDPNSTRVHHFFSQHTAKKPLRLLHFEGGRQWPNEATASEILGWLKMQPSQRKGLSTDTHATWFETRKSYAEAQEKQNNLSQALESWQALAVDFPEKSQAANIPARVARLKQSDERRSQVRNRRESLKKETQTLDLFDSYLKPNLYDQTTALAENIAWWQQQHQTLSYLIQNPPSDEQKATAIRLLEYLWQVSYLDGLTYLEQSRFAPASYHFRIATQLFPDKPFAHYALACAYAGLDEPEQAISALGESVKTGLGDPNLIELQPLFNRFRSNPGFVAISKKFKGSTIDSKTKQPQDEHH